MAEVTVTVPAEHVPALREGVLIGIASDIEWARTMHEETDDHLLGRLAEERIKPAQLRALETPIQALAEDVKILEQVWEWEDDGPVDVTGEQEALAHLIAETADRILAPELRDEVNVSPIDSGIADNVDALTASITWMVDTAAQLNLEEVAA